MLDLDPGVREDRELLQLLAIIINRSLINYKKIQGGEQHGSLPVGDRAVSRLREKILEDLRRGVSSIVIWKRKNREFGEEDLYRVADATARMFFELFSG